MRNSLGVKLSMLGVKWEIIFVYFFNIKVPKAKLVSSLSLQKRLALSKKIFPPIDYHNETLNP